MGRRTYNRRDRTVLLDVSLPRLLLYPLPADGSRERRADPGRSSYRGGRVSRPRLIHAEATAAN